MMQSKQFLNLRCAMVLVKCSKDEHNDCRAIRDAVLKLRPAQEAYTTNAEVDGQRWCVAASALIDINETDQFKRDLDNLVAYEGGTSIRVDDLRLFVDGQ